MSKKPLLTLLSSAALSAVAALSVPISAGVAAPAAASENARAIKGSYIVQLSESPVVAYTGDIKGYAATKPRAGQKIDPFSSKVVNYKSYLESRHDAVLASVGGKKFYSFGYSFNGFAARMTEAQANALASTKGVVKVTQDAIHLVDTSSTPDFL
ncbi:MAG TPA: protease inhibitor I9 family protein, partial [Steroidobacteraceae bacterium]|nr:protease inhibitor I9 family protein [Steroidobacteraceae bacterium]